MKVGDYVTYVPFEGCDESIYENGRVKSLSDDTDFVFIVTKCGNNWDNFQNFTGQKVNVSNLKRGWI